MGRGEVPGRRQKVLASAAASAAMSAFRLTTLDSAVSYAAAASDEVSSKTKSSLGFTVLSSAVSSSAAAAISSGAKS
jgi:hypothetical protein